MYKDLVYQLVRQIPKGKVMTYGQIAGIVSRQHSRSVPGRIKAHSGSDIGRRARQVGWALHQNRDPDIPCHRVVDRSGRLAPNFAFDGPEEQKRRLIAESVKFTDNMHVDLRKSLWLRKGHDHNKLAQ